LLVSDVQHSGTPQAWAPTVAALVEWHSHRQSERAFFDRDYTGTDRVFTWEDGREVHPDVMRQRFNRLS
jgi:hypothetical protein